MSFLTKIIIFILANSASILVASHLIRGFVFQGSWLDLLIAGTVLGSINYLLKPVVKLFSLPKIILTLGLFTVIINIGLLLFTASILPSLTIQGFWAAFWGIIIISLTNHLIYTDVRPRTT